MEVFKTFLSELARRALETTTVVEVSLRRCFHSHGCVEICMVIEIKVNIIIMKQSRYKTKTYVVLLINKGCSGLVLAYWWLRDFFFAVARYRTGSLVNANSPDLFA